jgi:hypothetical protein
MIQWGTPQNNLGNVLRTLAERESGTTRLDEAVEYRAAPAKCTRERVPPRAAMTQNNAERNLGGNPIRELQHGRRS